MSILGFLIYIPLQIAFVPLAIVGGLLVAYRQIVVSSRIGISQTAIEIINGRWTMHVFGIRPDDATARLAGALSNTSLFGLWLALFPLWIKYRISRQLFLYPRVPDAGTEGIADMVVARTLYFDRVIQRVIGDVEQFVVLGAGYDTRCYGELRRANVDLFELDQPVMQQHKRAALAAAGIDTAGVQFVEVDFSSENAFEKLAVAGFSPARKTLFLWEGVTLYLSESDVRKTMQHVRQSSPAGSVLLCDLYGERMLKIGRRGGAQKVLEQTGEGLKFGLGLSADFQAELAGFVESEQFDLGESFFLGSKADAGPYMVVVEMIAR